MSSIIVDSTKASQLITIKAFSVATNTSSTDFDNVRTAVDAFIENYPSVSFEYDGNTYQMGEDGEYALFVGQMAEFLAKSKVEELQVLSIH